MTEAELEQIVARRETERLELKESFGAEAVETACAFANAGGGYIVVGVDDKGLPSKRLLRMEGLRDYENRIATGTEPSVAVDAENVPYGGGEVVVLRVPENPLKPVATKGRCYVRKGSVNHQMSPAEIAECHLKSTGGSMDAVFVPGVTREDLDMGAVRRYMERATAKGRRNFAPGEDPWEALLKLEWVRSDREITRAAYLLFAKDPQRKFPQAVIHAGAFGRDGASILDSHDARGNIQDQIGEALAFVQRNIHCALVVAPGAVEHEMVWDYPPEALRETLANAVCHRDYGSPHDIQIKVYPDGLVVSSPGQLPFDMPMEMLMNPRHASRPRNKIVAQAFYDMGIIEHYGRGIIRIQEECRKNGTPCPEWKDGNWEFATTYRIRGEGESGGANKQNTTQTTTQIAPKTTQSTTQTTTQSAVGRRGPTSVQKRIMEYLKGHPTASRRMVAEHLGDITPDGVKYHLARMQERGWVRRVGGDNTGVWVVFDGEGEG